MILYICFILYYLLVIVYSTNIGIKSGVQEPLFNSVGLRLFTEISNHDIEDCTVEVFPEECCLDVNDNKCNIVELIGDASEIITAGTTKTITMVAPLLDQFGRRGHCTLYVDSSAVSTPKNIVRDTVKIRFDTKTKSDVETNQFKACNRIDEDAFNDCKPVNCDIYYNGQKCHYSVIKRRCTSIPSCLSNNAKVPKIVYNPISNKCINNESINEKDFEVVRQLVEESKIRKPKDLMIIKSGNRKGNKKITTAKNTLFEDAEENEIKILKNHTHKSKGTKFLKKKVKPEIKTVNTVDFNPVHDSQLVIKNKTLNTINRVQQKLRHSNINCFVKYLANNKYTTIVLSGIILMQCLLICSMAYYLSQKCNCCKKKQIVKKFFNYHQDASVTTPLIGTSNIDTETTEYQYLSESSNYVEKKIKCYKACQKEQNNNMKLSMSDDILSKCINRRDWNRLPRSETIPEVKIDDDIKIYDKKDNTSKEKKSTEIKINFQEDYINITNKDKANCKKESKVQERLMESSEKEIRCHSYDHNCNLTGYNKNSTALRAYKKDKHTESTEMGAQAYFSNDSIDDFLSERGVIFVGDIASRYSFTSVSSVAKSTASSKTSKNNIVKNVISLLSNKSKGPSSDPGVKKSTTDIDLELLHLSRASVFTSSNEIDQGKDNREWERVKESTSSV